MKRNFIFAMMMILTSSCTRLETYFIQSTVAPEITASFEHNDTKTTLYTDSEGIGTIWWSPKEEINVFYNTSPSHYISNNEQQSPKVTFWTSDIIGATESASALTNIWGLYPYDTEAICDGSSITTTIPSAQKAVAGTFDDCLFTSIAHSDITTMTFYNVLGGIKFSLSRDDIKSIKFKGNCNENLAGKIKLTMNSENRPTATVLDGRKTIILTPKVGKTFSKDTNYYIVMLPAILSRGFTMEFETDTKIGTLMFNANSIEIKRSVFKVKENIDSFATFVDKPIINALCFTSDGEQYISLSNYGGNSPYLQYSYDGEVWADWDYSALTFGNVEKPTIYIRGNNQDGISKSYTQYSSFYFSKNASVQCCGNIMHLLCYFEDLKSIQNRYAFYQLFSNCTNLTNAPELPATSLAYACYEGMFSDCTSLTTAPQLPATSLANACYERMFSRCTNLTTAPQLPATSLAYNCYSYMFSDCTSLTTAPELPATSLDDNCYSYMFSICTNLTNAPELPATSLAYACYECMFSRCTNLTTAPQLPATSLAYACYQGMFSDCTSLTTAPELPATSLANACYERMFSRCTNLTTAPQLPATSLASACYEGMFSDCTSLTTAPELPATILVSNCYQSMFSSCRNLHYVKCLAEDISANNCTNQWLYNTSKTGTFIKSPANDKWERGNSGIPSGWRVEEFVQ